MKKFLFIFILLMSTIGLNAQETSSSDTYKDHSSKKFGIGLGGGNYIFGVSGKYK